LIVSHDPAHFRVMKLIRALIALAGLLVAAHGFAQSELIERAEALELRGKFTEAATVLTNALKDSSLPAAQRKQLEFEMDRLVRIRKDYPFTKDTLFEKLEASVKDLTRDEFEQWVTEGRFDSRDIDGEQRYMSSSVSNLYFRHPELEARRLKPKDTAAFEQARLATVQSIKQAALTEKQPYVLPKRFRNTMTVTVNAGAAPPGEIIRAWLPIPRRYPFQKDFELRSSSPPAKEINRRESSIRAVHLEQAAQKGEPTEFKIEYEYTAFGVFFDINAEDVKSVDARDAELAPFLREAPHVQFTPGIRALSREIVGDETNAFRKAKKCYDWIAGQIKYSYATEYSTIRNISEYCRTKSYGDCGQEALLFITLCRLSGIPARWQSGWNTFPGGKTRLVRNLSRAARLGARGSVHGHLGDALRPHTHARTATRGSRFLFRRAGPMAHGRKQRSLPGTFPAQEIPALGHRGFSARRGGMGRTQSLLRPIRRRAGCEGSEAAGGGVIRLGAPASCRRVSSVALEPAGKTPALARQKFARLRAGFF
jgi:transglutaminase-like putative cysteine protease